MMKDIAAYMHRLKQHYVILNNEFSAHKQKRNNIQRETKYLSHMVNGMTERAEDIRNMREQLDGLYTQRRKKGLFASKKAIDEQINQIEFLYNNATAYFKQHFYIAPENTAAEVKRLEYTLNANERIQEQVQNRLPALVGAIEKIALEYQRQKLLTETRSDKYEIQYRLTKLSTETCLQFQSERDKLAWTRNERIIDMVTDRNFEKITADIPEEQKKVLIRQRKYEMATKYAALRVW